MSTIALTAPRTTARATRPAARPHDAARRTRLRLTTRGRRVLAVVSSLPAVIAVSIVMFSGGGAVASAEAPSADRTFYTVTVLPGDTLWSIAGEIAPEADPRDVVDAVMGLNAMSSARLDIGQTIAVPDEYAPSD